MATEQGNQMEVQIRVKDSAKQPPMEVVLGYDCMQLSYRSIKDALTLTFHRTIRVPDNQKSINALPPNLGKFPVFLVQDYVKQVPVEVAEKSGVFLTMYQREAMWINFKASLPFAIRIFVGGINAVSGSSLHSEENQARRLAGNLKPEQSSQDYMVVPGQPWLDGIVCNDGQVRQFVAQPAGSGFSVESQITGQDTHKGIQIEVIPIKCGRFPEHMDVRYSDRQRRVDTRRLEPALMGLGPLSTWKDMKVALETEFEIPVNQQVLYPAVQWNHYLPIRDHVKISDYYFKPGFVLGVSHDRRDARRPPRGVGGGHVDYKTANMLPAYSSMSNSIGQMGMAAGGLIKQTIVTDPHPAYLWDTDAAILFHVHILDTATFSAVTGKKAPETPISAKTYKEHDRRFYKIWGEEPTGIKGNFEKVKSIAALEEARAKAGGTPYVPEEGVPQRVSVIGTFDSTFEPVGIQS